MRERIAIIDLGTNTFHLLIADSEDATTKILYREKQPVKIGLGGINRGVITEEAIQRALACLMHFKNILNVWSVTRVQALGTSALRNAVNGHEIIQKIKTETGIEVKLISGDEEAEYIYYAEALLKSGVTALAYETIEVNRRLPLLEPMSEIAGRMSVLVGGYFLAKHFGGSGVLLGGVPGVLPGKVIVLGGGVAGINAARMAQGLGADVTILEVDLDRMRFLDITLHTAHTLYSNEAHLMELLPNVDLLIGAVLVPGAKAPKLIRREMLRRMRPGSVVVALSRMSLRRPS